MGTTSDAIAAGSANLQVTAVIEGFEYILTDGDPSLAWNAYQDSSDFAGYGDFSGAASGMSVHWEGDQRISPWKPFTEPGLVKLQVVPGTLNVGGGAEPISDIVGTTVFKRTGGTETSITANVDCNDTSITVQRADDFAASGNLYMGPETIAYSSRNTGTDIFTVSTRGLYPAFGTDTDARFARTHKPLTATEDDIGIPPLVSSEPRTWVGRWVAIWLHRKAAPAGGGAVDRIDAPNMDRSGAHLAFAGQIVGVEDVDGATWFEVLDVRAKIYGTRLNRDPFKAKIKEGHWLNTGDELAITTTRDTTHSSGNYLVVVAGAPASANEIQTGRYDCFELVDHINAWLQGEKAAARILFNTFMEAAAEEGGGLRGKITVDDPTTTAGLQRRVQINGTSSWVGALTFMGWDGEIGSSQSSSRVSFVTGRPPKRFLLDVAGTAGIEIEEPRGTWISQATLLPVGLRDTVAGWDGVVKIGDLGYARAKYNSATSMNLTGSGTEAFFPGQSGELQDSGGLYVTVEDDVSLEVSQVLVVEAAFSQLLLRILLSTGTSGFNSATYDNLSEQMSCGIPYSILGDDFVTEVGNLSCAGVSCSAIIDGPISFHELFKADFELRRCFFAWGNGRLNVKAWATPTSTYASATLDETTKASPSGTQDKNRSGISESADYYNIVTIKYNIDADGKYADELVLKDAVSIRAFGERATTIEARNTFRRVGAVGTPIDAVLDHYSGFFGFTSRPWQVVKRTIDHTKFEVCTPGAILSITDKYVRSPATGLRYSNATATGGLSGFPGMVVGQSFTWGGVEPGRDGGKPIVTPPHGEVEVMISPQRTIAVYAPCAQVDDTAATSGYVAGTKVLTCYAHEHSETSDVADATRFAAGDKVRVIEIDPSIPGTALAWADTVASQTGNTITLTTGLAGWDTTKKYRITYDIYATATTAQKAYCYQADDADGLIVDTVQAYAFAYTGSSQSTTVTLSTGQEVPARYATDAYGDGKPLDVGYERDAVRLANNLINYKTAPQQPTQYTEVRNFTGGGTRQVVEMQPIFLGIGVLTAGRTRLLSIAPRLRSTTGATATVRVSLCRRRPTGTTRDDVTFVGPYVQVSFSTTSTTFSIPTAQTIDISHLKMTDTVGGGWGWLVVEIITATEYTGMGRCVLGALS